MKLIIDVPEEVYDCLKGIAEDTTSLDPYSLADIIVNKSKPYEERPHGKWINETKITDMRMFFRCSRCNAYNDKRSNFCPDCGADMRGGAKK